LHGSDFVSAGRDGTEYQTRVRDLTEASRGLSDDPDGATLTAMTTRPAETPEITIGCSGITGVLAGKGVREAEEAANQAQALHDATKATDATKPAKPLSRPPQRRTTASETTAVST
jgi:hypothetical protein